MGNNAPLGNTEQPTQSTETSQRLQGESVDQQARDRIELLYTQADKIITEQAEAKENLKKTQDLVFLGFIILLVMVAGMVLGYIASVNSNDRLNDKVDTAINNYSNLNDKIDTLQGQFNLILTK